MGQGGLLLLLLLFCIFQLVSNELAFFIIKHKYSKAIKNSNTLRLSQLFSIKIKAEYDYLAEN